MSKKCVFDGFSQSAESKLTSPKFNSFQCVRLRYGRRAMLFSSVDFSALFTCIMPDLVYKRRLIVSEDFHQKAEVCLRFEWHKDGTVLHVSVLPVQQHSSGLPVR